MRRAGVRLSPALVSAALLAGCGGPDPTPPADDTPPALSAPGAAVVTGLPLLFETNQGQTDQRVDFLARTAGYALFLTPEELVWVVTPPHPLRIDARQDELLLDDALASVLRMTPVGARQEVNVVGEAPLAATTINHVIGSDESEWITDIEAHSRVRYEGLYQGIDLLLHGENGSLRYDFTVAPDADPGEIRLRFTGARALTLDENGNLIIDTAVRRIVHTAPRLFETVDGADVPVDGRFVLSGDGVGFDVGGWRRDGPLTIDPEIVFSTYLGGGDLDPFPVTGLGMTAVGDGRVYLTSSTASADFPLVGAENVQGASDAVVLSLDLSDPLNVGVGYAIFLVGQSDDTGTDIAVAGGDAYVSGYSSSEDFPVSSQPIVPSGPRVLRPFVLHLDPSGVVVRSTFLSVWPSPAWSLAVDTEGGNGFSPGVYVAVEARGDLMRSEDEALPSNGFQNEFERLSRMSSAAENGGTAEQN